MWMDDDGSDEITDVMDDDSNNSCFMLTITE